MELAKILQYQKIDMDLYRLEKEYSQSKEIERKRKIVKLFEDKKEALNKLSIELDELLLQVSKLDAKLDSIASGAITGINPEQAADEEALALLERNFNKCEEEIAAQNKELNRILKRINDINNENRRTNEEMIQLNNEYKVVNAALEKKKAEMLLKAKPIALQLKNLLPEVEGPEFEKYKEIRKNKKMPAFVVYHDGNCGACGMEIAIEVGKKLVKVGDIAECPHCGRMVYKYQ